MAAISPANSATAATPARAAQTPSRSAHRTAAEPFASRLQAAIEPHAGPPPRTLAEQAVRPVGDALDGQGERRRPALCQPDTDPLVRTLAQCAGPWSAGFEASVPAADPGVFARLAPVEQVLLQLVRRIAWSGDAKAGSARIELGSGELAGATLLVHAEAGIVHVSLELPPGADPFAWRERIGQRLGRRGIEVGSLDVS
jgi:hypothetical protein